MQDYYDGIAQGYEELYGKEQQNKLEFIKTLISYTPSSRILDLGCGSGCSSYFDCTLIGIDPSKELIAIAKEKFTDKKTHQFFCKPAESLPEFSYAKEEFDYCISLSAAHHFEDFPKLLKEIYRVSKECIITIPKKSRAVQTIINAMTREYGTVNQYEEDKDIIIHGTKNGI